VNPSGRLSEAEAATVLDMQGVTLSKWRQRSYGPPYIKAGGKVSYRMIDLEEWIEKCRVVPSEVQPKRIKLKRSHHKKAV
jgi:hypothetical protein